MKIVLLICVMISYTVWGQQTSALDTLKQAYEQKITPLLSQYGKSLDSIQGELKKKGDLDNYLILQEEKSRFEKEGSVPYPAETKAAVRPAALDYYKSRTILLQHYLKALDGLVKKAVMEGRIEEAKATKAEREREALVLENWEGVLQGNVKDEPKVEEKKGAVPTSTDYMKDLILHFTFESVEKSVIEDKSGNENEGVLHGGARGSRGLRNRVYVFDGKKDYVVTREKIDLSSNTPWSMSLWVKATDKPRDYDNMVSLGKSFNARGVFGVGAGADSKSLNINLWCEENFRVRTDVDYSKAFAHIAVVYDGTKVFIYVNGDLKDDRRVSLSIVGSPIWIGGRTGGYEGQYFSGSLGNIMLFKRALTAQNVQTLYKSQQ
jgi:Concanavalin A-like lectin/glucanases superfamily